MGFIQQTKDQIIKNARNNVTDYTSNLRKYRAELFYNSKWTTDENNRLETLLKEIQKAYENLICLFSKTTQYV